MIGRVRQPNSAQQRSPQVHLAGLVKLAVDIDLDVSDQLPQIGRGRADKPAPGVLPTQGRLGLSVDELVLGVTAKQLNDQVVQFPSEFTCSQVSAQVLAGGHEIGGSGTVSYTHLTLPTI